MKAIETVYNGYNFRSRLEARWAVFMDTLHIPYTYEPEGFDLGDSLMYLPDFWLPNQEMWLEIKSGQPTHEEKLKAYRLADQSLHNVVILSGTPKAPVFSFESQQAYADYVGEMFFGRFNHDDTPFNPFISFWLDSMPEFLRECGYPVPEFDGRIETIRQWIEEDKKYYLTEYGIEHPKWGYGVRQSDLLWADTGDGFTFALNFGVYPHLILTPRLISAYTRAQQARFEHGENPLNDIPF